MLVGFMFRCIKQTILLTLILNFVSFILNKLYLSDANPDTDLGSVSGSLGT